MQAAASLGTTEMTPAADSGGAAPFLSAASADVSSEGASEGVDRTAGETNQQLQRRNKGNDDDSGGRPGRRRSSFCIQFPSL